jgi:hypothetical protein
MKLYILLILLTISFVLSTVLSIKQDTKALRVENKKVETVKTAKTTKTSETATKRLNLKDKKGLKKKVNITFKIG